MHRLLAIIVLFLGLCLLAGGAWLVSLGGSWYYLIAGAGFLMTGVLLFRNRAFALLIYALVVAGTLGAARPVAEELVVHEWGTFLAMSGSDGVALDGMYHEEHALPAFVLARSRDQLRLRSAITKGETPVIYFYTGRMQKVRVTANFTVRCAPT